MAEQIQVQFDELQSAATQFQNAAELARDARMSLVRAVDVLRSGAWQGTDANRFYSEFDADIFPAFNRLVDAMEQGNETIASIGRLFDAADDEAASLFKI